AGRPSDQRRTLDVLRFDRLALTPSIRKGRAARGGPSLSTLRLRCESPSCALLTRDRAAVLAGVEGLVAPGWLDGELVSAQRDVLGVVPGALVRVLARRRVVPAVLDGEEVVRIGHRLRVLVADDDAVAVEDAVAEA